MESALDQKRAEIEAAVKKAREEQEFREEYQKAEMEAVTVKIPATKHRGAYSAKLLGGQAAERASWMQQQQARIDAELDGQSICEKYKPRYKCKSKEEKAATRAKRQMQKSTTQKASEEAPCSGK